MSSFRKVIQEHRAATLAAAEAKRREELQMQETQRQFATEFSDLLASTARPMFQRFAAELAEEGLQAGIEELPDESGNPAIAAKFTASGRECMFRLAGDVRLLKVQRLTRIGSVDQGSAASSTLQSMSAAQLHQQLAGALQRALKLSDDSDAGDGQH
jgi:hypothetical protein